MRKMTIISKLNALEKAVAPALPPSAVTFEVTQTGETFRHGKASFSRSDLDAMKRKNRGLTIVVLNKGQTTLEYPNGKSTSANIDWGKL